MIELPNPFPHEGGVIRLLEPDDCDRDALIARLLNDTYDKPYVIEEGDSRALYFSRDFTQSAMCLSDPMSLEFAYTRMMMSCLLFVHEPKIILMLGLGGGSLAKYCYRHLPLARIVALEIDPDVLAFREQFLLPPDDARFSILQGDAADYLRTCQIRNDVVMIDAFDRHGFAAAVSSRGFYLDVHDALSVQGVMVANMVGPKSARAVHLNLIADVFNGNIVVLPIESDGNYLVFAFRDPGFEPRWRWIEGQATALQKRYGLDFPKFATALKRSRKDGYLKMTLIQSENNG